MVHFVLAIIFAVVFKMKDIRDGKFYAVKCFTREQEGRNESYKLIANELECISSSYLASIWFYEKELFVDTEQTTETEFPILVMDWVEGVTMDKYIHENFDEPFLLEMLTFRFCKLATWLLSQSFAHGDLKPDNLLVKENGSIVLVDYDGMFVPAMSGQRAREIGSPNFSYPSRTEEMFDESIDDFSIALIALALKAFSLKPELISDFCSNDFLLFKENDYACIHSCLPMTSIWELTTDKEMQSLLGAFMIAYANNSLSLVSPKLFSLSNPKAGAAYGTYLYNQAKGFCKEAKEKKQIDYNKAFKLFKKSAELGNAESQLTLGVFYFMGKGVDKDWTKAFKWYLKSAEQGNSNGQRKLAFCYKHGIGVNTDLSKTFEWYLKSAKQGNAEAQMEVAHCFETGLGTNKDLSKAFYWYSESANHNDPDGILNTGRCFEEGIGVNKDLSKAFEWYLKSAKQEWPDGLWRLGRCYLYGHGIKKAHLKHLYCLKNQQIL